MDKHDIERNNRQAGYYFFAHETMRFWKSGILDDYVETDTHIYFLTSEGSPRKYNKTPDDEEFMAYTSILHAKNQMQYYKPDYCLDLISVDAYKDDGTWVWGDAHFIKQKISFLESDLTPRKFSNG